MGFWKRLESKKKPDKEKGRPRSAGSEGNVPDHWTQYEGIPIDAEKIQLVIGLDFGTAYTKVVVSESRRAYAVPLGEGLMGTRNPYLLPGVVTVDEMNRVHLGTTASGQMFSNIKMRILDRDTGQRTFSLAAAFISFVLRKTRSWLMNTHRATYQSCHLDWVINVGLPSEHHDDAELKSFYKNVVISAWQASTKAGGIVLSDFNQDASNGHDSGMVFTFPEFVAQITGYVRSPRRRSDLHMLVDVGAGTVDISAFNVVDNDGEYFFPTFAGRVRHYGVHVLHRHRVQHAGTRRIPYKEGASDEEVAVSLGIPKSSLSEIDDPFRKRLFQQIKDVVEEARQKYPMSKGWKDGLPLFLCGGGASAALYADLTENIVRSELPCPMQKLDLPVPEKLSSEGLHWQEYSRLSVAYGLSFDPFDIGEVIDQSKTDEISEEREYGICRHCDGTGGLVVANSCRFCGGTGSQP